MEIPPGGEVHLLLATLARAGTVVTSRLHGTILALGLARPVLALSYDRKVDVVMGDLGLQDQRMEIATFDPADAVRLWEELDRRAPALTGDLARRVAGHRRDLHEHLDRMLRT